MTWWLDFATQIHPEKLARWWLNQPIPEKICQNWIMFYQVGG